MRSLTRAAGLAAALLFAPSAHANLTFGIYGNWDSQARKDAATAAMTNVVNRYNVYGEFTWGNGGNIPVYYNAGVPTAQSGYNGSIEFGGTWPNDRVAQHESNHWLGSGTYWNWGPQFNGAGIWTGPKMSALIQQFDGDGAVIRQSGVHFYNYGLNYDSEVTDDSILMRNIGLMYAMRQDMGIGPAADPWSATNVTLVASDPAGTSAFNWFGGGYSNANYQGWSDKYFAHAGAAYSTGTHDIRTPQGYPSWTFAGDSLTINGGGRLLFNGWGTTGIVTIKQLNLNGGTVRHDQFPQDLFQLTGRVTVNAASTFEAAQGNINVLAPINGAGSLTTRGANTTTFAGANTYTGTTTVAAGTLAFAGSQSNVGGVTVASGATLRVRAFGANAPALTTTSLALGTAGTSSLTLDLNSLDNVEPVISTGGFTANGTVNLTLQNAGALTSGVHKLVGYTSFGGSGTFPASPITLGPRSTGTLSNNGTDALNLNVVADRPVWSGGDNGNWVVGTTGANKNWKLQTAGSATDYIAGDNVLFDDSATGSTSIAINNANVSPAATTFNNAAKSFTVSSSGGFGIAGAGGLTKNGVGSVAITTANTFTGDVVVNGGTLYANPGNGANNRAFSFVHTITVNGGGTLRAGANGLFGWDGSQEHPITVNAGGTLSALGTLTTDVAVGLVTLNGGTMSAVSTSATDYGSFRFDEATDKLSVVADSVVSATHVKFGNPSAAIDVAAGKTLTFSGTVTDATSGGISYLTKSGPGALLMSGPNTYTGATTVNAGVLTVSGSISNSPTTNVNNGGAVYVTGTLSNATTNLNNGTLNVSGHHTSSADLWVGLGSGGLGALNVQSGGVVTANVVHVGAAGSPTAVGVGTGTLAAGGTINTNQWFVIGQSGAAGSSGTFTVNGGTLNVHTNGADVGNLEVGTFDAANATLNVNAGSNVKVLNNAVLVLGAQGNHSGTSVVNQNGGNVSFYADGGTVLGGTGRVVLASAGNPTGNYTYNLNGGTLTVPRVVRENTANNPSTVFNFNGGTIRATTENVDLMSNLTAANVKAGGGTIDTNGHSVSLSQPLRHDAALGATPDGGLTKTGGGTLLLSGASTFTGTTTISNGTLRLDGSVTSPVSVQAGTLTGNGQVRSNLANGAIVGPGVSGPGRLTVTGNYQQAAGAKLQIGITGTTPITGFDRLEVGGTASLAGTLELALGGGFTPSVGQTFSVLSAGSETGQFDTVAGVTAPASAGLSLAVTYSPTGVTATAALPGDVNLDRTVGPGDFNLLASNFGKTGQTWASGDLDGDGLVGPGDFNLLASTFGESALAGISPSITAADRNALETFAATNVPEPAGMAAAFVAGLAMIRRRRNR